MWILACCLAAAAPPEPSSDPTPATPEAVKVVDGPDLEVGQQLVVCTRSVPAFQVGPYTCGPHTLEVTEHPSGPTITGKQLWATAEAASLSPGASTVTLMSYDAGDDPNTATAGGAQLDEPDGVASLFGDCVATLSDGRRAVFLSRRAKPE